MNEYGQLLCNQLYEKLGLGGVMVLRACSNVHAICKDLGSSLTYDQWSFPPVIKFLHLKNQTPTLISVPCALII